VVSYFVVLLIYAPWITLVCAIPIPVALTVAEALRHPLYRTSLSARKAAAQVSSHLQRTLTGIGILRLFGREGAENERLEALSIAQTRWNVKSSLLQTGIMPVYATLASLGIVGVIILAGQRVIEGDWTLGRFTAYLAMFTAMAVRTRVAANVINRFHAAQAAWDRVKEKILADQAALQTVEVTTGPVRARAGAGAATANPGANAQAEGGARVELQEMSFRFPGATQDALRGVSFGTAPGAWVAVTGPVGSGKSALAAALTGLYPYQGRMQVGARELRDLDAAERVRTVAYAGQDAFIFSATIAENITLQSLDAVAFDDPSLQRALFVAALTEDLALFPDGLATVVGERGARVSGGQRQRIALARAIYAATPLLLLDDPFSAVDIGTERRMIERLRGALSQRTVFIFSHRLATFVQADKILVLEHGRLAEEGDHASLMAADRTYARIYNAQTWLERENHG